MKKTLYLLLISIIIVILASIFASSYPDGLEWVAEKLNFGDRAISSSSIFTDYKIPFIQNSFASTLLAGLFGILIIYGVFWSIKKGLSKK